MSHKQENEIPNIYKNKTVLVTGHTGFKGTWLSIWLQQLGANVVGYSLTPNTCPSIFEETNIEQKVTHLIGDIRDGEQIREVVAKYKPEFVFHLAAQPLVGLSYKEPKLTYETNVMGLVNLFEAVRVNDSVKFMVNVTSDKCYENKEWVWGYRENDQMGGHDPYSSSKGCSELITSAYRRSFFVGKVALASARAGNVIGGGDWAQDRIVPDCVKALVKKKPILIRNPDSRRPWQHVLEPISGYLWLGALLTIDPIKYADGWNFGPNTSESVTVKQLVGTLIDCWGEGSWKTDGIPNNQSHEATFLKLDTSRASLLLNWFGIYSFKEAINETLDWYKAYYEHKDNMYNKCIQQIKRYLTKAREKQLPWSNTLNFKFNMKSTS